MIRIMPVSYNIKHTMNYSGRAQIMNDATIKDNEENPEKQNITADDTDTVEVKSGRE